MRYLDALERAIVPALLLAAGVIVVQAHAIPYWQERMGPAVGLLASLAAEAVGLYLVYQPGRLARGIGALLVVVMVLVPAWQIAGPEYRTWLATDADRAAHGARQAEARALLPSLEVDIAAQERSLREDEAKSRTRAGWLPELERMRAALEARRAERRQFAAALAAPAPPAYDGWAAAPRVLPVLALLIAFQLVNAYAMVRISGFRHGGVFERTAGSASASGRGFSAAGAPKTQPEISGQSESRGAQAIGNSSESGISREGSTPPAAMEIPRGTRPVISAPLPAKGVTVSGTEPVLDAFTVRSLRDRVRAALDRSGRSQRDFAQGCGVGEVDLSSLMSMFDRERKGGRKPSRKAVETLLARYPAAETEARPS